MRKKFKEFLKEKKKPKKCINCGGALPDYIKPEYNCPNCGKPWNIKVGDK